MASTIAVANESTRRNTSARGRGRVSFHQPQTPDGRDVVVGPAVAARRGRGRVSFHQLQRRDARDIDVRGAAAACVSIFARAGGPGVGAIDAREQEEREENAGEVGLILDLSRRWTRFRSLRRPLTPFEFESVAGLTSYDLSVSRVECGVDRKGYTRSRPSSQRDLCTVNSFPSPVPTSCSLVLVLVDNGPAS